MSEEARQYWNEIIEGAFQFARSASLAVAGFLFIVDSWPALQRPDAREAEEVQKVSKADLLLFFDSHVSASSSNRRKLSVYFTPSALTTSTPLPPKTECVTNLLEFKQVSLWPECECYELSGFC